MNGIGKFFGSKKKHNLIQSALQYALWPSQALETDEDKSSAHELIRYGLLRYYRKQVSMSPALLTMTLSMFGEDDITVSDYEDFERLVALRELALLRIAGVRVRIVYLTKQIPSHNSNSSYTKFLNSPSKSGASDSVDDYYDFHLQLPRGLFNHVRSSSSPLTLVDPGTALVLVNAPLAAGPDVIVITDKSTKLCQAKFYKDGYKPSQEELKPELLKLGAASKQASNRDPLPHLTRVRIKYRGFLVHVTSTVRAVMSMSPCLDSTQHRNH